MSRAAGKAAHVPSPRSAPCCHLPRHKRRSQGALHVGLQGLPRRGGRRPPWGVRPRAAGLRARRPGGAAWWPGCRAVVNRPCAGALTWGSGPLCCSGGVGQPWARSTRALAGPLRTPIRGSTWSPFGGERRRCSRDYGSPSSLGTHAARPPAGPLGRFLAGGRIPPREAAWHEESPPRLR